MERESKEGRALVEVVEQFGSIVEDEAGGKQEQTKECASLLARLLAKKDLSARDNIVKTGIEQTGIVKTDIVKTGMGKTGILKTSIMKTGNQNKPTTKEAINND